MEGQLLQILFIVVLGLLLYVIKKYRELQKQIRTIHNLPREQSSQRTVDYPFQQEEYDEKLISLLRNYRHDWLNHMQVILGYVSLKKSDKIATYINQVNEEAMKRTIVSKLKEKKMAVFLYMLPIEYPKVQVQVELDEELTSIDFQDQEPWILENLHYFFNLLQRETIDHYFIHSVILSISRLENQIVVNIEYEGNFSPFYEQMIQQGEIVTQQGGEFFIDLYNEQEIIIEFHFPIKARGVANVC